ncbi:hypothetical protein NST23_10720 [Brevibacillus sp. FSL K6-0770]|jgi:ribosome-binding protein aMBF1 (putative translation factor)|nr:hypothetical protein [Brevibacillus parabrevis]MBU8711858.1 hypothetical protein [Brevibacillus parabrevis]MED2257803.1 hypothetical protein [Brevibacillus parabrevis]
MTRVCEVCGRVEEESPQDQEAEAVSSTQMSLLHVCESCIADRQHPHF